MKKVFPEPQSPNRPTETGTSTSLAASTEQSALTSFVIPRRSLPDVVSDLYPAIMGLSTGLVGVDSALGLAGSLSCFFFASRGFAFDARGRRRVDVLNLEF